MNTGAFIKFSFIAVFLAFLTGVWFAEWALFVFFGGVGLAWAFAHDPAVEEISRSTSK